MLLQICIIEDPLKILSYANSSQVYAIHTAYAPNFAENLLAKIHQLNWNF